MTPGLRPRPSWVGRRWVPSAGLPGRQFCDITGRWTLRPSDDTLMAVHVASRSRKASKTRQDRSTTRSLRTGRSSDLMSTPQILAKGWNGIDPADAGWSYVSFAVEALAAGQSLTRPANGQERAFVPLSGIAEASA